MGKGDWANTKTRIKQNEESVDLCAGGQSIKLYTYFDDWGRDIERIWETMFAKMYEIKVSWLSLMRRSFPVGMPTYGICW